MTNTLLTRESPKVIQFFKNLEYLAKLLNTDTDKFRPLLNGDRFITDSELARILKLTSRTLVEHRMSGLLPYYKLGGKILYKESDIIKVLESNRFEAFNEISET